MYTAYSLQSLVLECHVLLYVHVYMYMYVLLHSVCVLVTYNFGNSQVCIHVRMPNESSHAFICIQYLYLHVQIHEYSDAQKERKKDKAAQHNTRDNFSRGTRTHASCILGVMLYQLSY